MIDSYFSEFTWILICTLLNLNGVPADGNNLMPLADISKEAENKEVLRELYLIREKKESEDPMNYLSRLYSDMDLSRRNVPYDTSMDGIVDPPQAEIQFRKKVPNCASEFNITKILELVDDDKKQRKCPCSCIMGKGGKDIYKMQKSVNEEGNEAKLQETQTVMSEMNPAYPPRKEDYQNVSNRPAYQMQAMQLVTQAPTVRQQYVNLPNTKLPQDQKKIMNLLTPGKTGQLKQTASIQTPKLTKPYNTKTGEYKVLPHKTNFLKQDQGKLFVPKQQTLLDESGWNPLDPSSLSSQFQYKQS